MIDILTIITAASLTIGILFFIEKRITSKKIVTIKEQVNKYEKELFAKQEEINRLASDRDKLIKYEAITDVEAAIAEKRSEADKYMVEINSKAAAILKSTNDSVEHMEATFHDLQKRYLDGLETYKRLREDLSLYEEKLDIIEYGIYTPVYSFEYSGQHQVELYGVREKQKEMIRQNKAAICEINWSIDGSETMGKIMVQKQKKLMLRAFNGECDYLISKVKWNNVNQIRHRLLVQYESVNKLGEANKIQITNEYKRLKLDELLLEHEYQLKRQEEKEAQRLAQEQIREEEKARKEYEQAQKKAEEEARLYQKALSQAREEITQTDGYAKEQLLSKINRLETELQEAIQKAQRAQSMAEQTKSGHVYVISNIGSFGENIYKIGLTRRLEPMDRVRELGDASVPFKFDVHAMMFSDDAPKLESELHRLFDAKKINMVNNRKEFFNIPIDEIEAATKKLGVNVEFIKIPEAKEYRETVAILEKNKQQTAIKEPTISEFPETI
jgi:hypothetical protein